jgi:hypothetical protein
MVAASGSGDQPGRGTRSASRTVGHPLDISALTQRGVKLFRLYRFCRFSGGRPATRNGL